MASLREQLLPFATGTQKACARKMRYVSQRRADGVIRARSKHAAAPLYSYACTHCDGWHITRMKPPTVNVTCDEDHVYRADGIVIPGVTEVLSLFADYARVPRGVLEHKRKIGHAVHSAIALYEDDRLEPDSIDDEWAGFFEGWIKLKHDMPGKVVASEVIVFHKKLRYAGRLDLNYLLTRDRALWQWDVKCVDQMSDATSLQTAAYSEAWNSQNPENKITKRGGVQLKPDGTYRFFPYADRTDFAIFCNALAIRNWILNHGGK